MRKMYFAMIPKRSFLEDAAIVAGLGAGLVLGSKWLLGEEKYNAYKAKLKDRVMGGAAEFGSAVRGRSMGPDTGTGINDEETDARAREEEEILERIRRASQK